MKKIIKGVLFLMLIGLLSACGDTTDPVTSTQASTVATTTATTADPGVFLPDFYFDFRDANTLYSCSDFHNLSAQATENGMRMIFLDDDGDGICFDPYFSLPSPSAKNRFAIEEYHYVVILADTTRADLPGIFRFRTRGLSADSYPSIYFTYSDTGRQKILLDLTDASSVQFVAPQDAPLQGLCTDFRLDVLENEANVSDEFTLEAVAFFKTLEEAERFTALPTSSASEPSDTVIDSSDKWLAEEFSNPSAGYRARKLLYNFNVGYDFTLDSLQHMGYGGVLNNVPYNADYLKDREDFALLDRAFAQARDKGMELWLYDEYQWPSGKAFGYVIDSNPDFEATGVEMLMISGKGNIDYTLSDDYLTLLGASLRTTDGLIPLETDGRSVRAAHEGSYSLFLFARRYTYSPDRTEDRSDFTTLRDVDLLNPDAVAKFIEITYDKYRDELGESFADVAAFFTDEPNLGNRDYQNFVVWTDALPQAFFEMHGYDLLEHLPSLFMGTTELDRTVRINFYQTVSELFSRAYTQQISAWCAENGVSSSGHLLFEESLFRQIETYGGDFMRIVSEMDIPGGDILHVEAENLLNRDTEVGSVIGLKYVASAAKNVGKTDVMLEFTPLANTNARFLDDPARYAIEGATIATFCGANTFCVICPDSSFTVSALQTFNTYIGRINALLDQATTVTPIGLFVPTDSARAVHLVDTSSENSIDKSLKNCAMTLLQNGLDFTFLDSFSIESAEVQNGKLKIGLGEYAVVLMPETTVLSVAVAEKLAEFEAQGGQVIWTGRKPTASDRLGEGEALQAILANLGESISIYDAKLIPTLQAAAAPELIVSGADSGIWISHYTRLDCQKDIYYVANLSASTVEFTVSFPDNSTFDVYTPMDGSITTNHVAELTVPAYHGVLIVR
ncbi:MAG: hypothetical protein IKU55_06170 [Clostridia bacterium]|nr:hypothetical protein [Clostridia bacterium]